MRPLSRTFSLNVQRCAKTCFNFKELPAVRVERCDASSNYDYQSRFPVELYDRYREHMATYWRSDSLSPKQIGTEIMIHYPRSEAVSNLNVDGNGSLEFRLREEFIEAEIARIASRGAGEPLTFDLRAHRSALYAETAVVFPFQEIVQKPNINTFRGLNIQETYARLLESCGIAVERVSALQNYSAIHGVIYGYLREKLSAAEAPGAGPLSAIRFEEIAQFVARQNLRSQDEVSSFGRIQLSQIALNENMRDIFNQLTEVALTSQMLVISRFVEQKKPFQVFQQSEFQTAQFLLENAHHLTRDADGNALLRLADGSSVCVSCANDELTQLGLVLNYISKVRKTKNVRRFAFSCLVQDDRFYSQVQQAYAIIDPQVEIQFITHNDLFYQVHESQQNEVKVISFVITHPS